MLLIDFFFFMLIYPSSPGIDSICLSILISSGYRFVKILFNIFVALLLESVILCTVFMVLVLILWKQHKMN